MPKFTQHLSSKLSFLILLWSLLLFNACNNDNPPGVDPEENEYLVASTEITTVSKEQIADQARAINQLLPGYVKYGIKVYKISYTTKNTDGKEITASGALILPETTENISLISVQHGTIRTNDEAPSNFKPGYEASLFGSVFGSMGYIIAYPDYIGYGDSKDVPHPYEHRESLASSTLDMLRASKEFLEEQQNVKWDKKLYIAGYSEGGYATMSLQKKIEEEAASEFNLRGSSCGAGAYDKTAFMKYIIDNTTHKVSAYNKLYLWVLLTYDRIYSLNKPMAYYFKEPYATQIAQSGMDVNLALSFDEILTDTFKKEVNDGTNKGFIDAIADNDVYNWKPKTPTRLFHGNKDELVFYFNSETAFNTMKALGADVQLTTIPNGTHGTSVTPFLIGTLGFIQSTP